jgi:hypothetical protein
MHTLKEILAEPQTMYDGGVVRMADGGGVRHLLKDQTGNYGDITSGSTTMKTEEPIWLSPKQLQNIPGAMGEEEFRGDVEGIKYKKLRESIEEKGYRDYEGNPLTTDPIKINVNAEGKPFITEGNHRLIEAIESNRDSIPVEITYLGGSENIEGQLNPDLLEEGVRVLKGDERGGIRLSPEEWKKLIGYFSRITGKALGPIVGSITGASPAGEGSTIYTKDEFVELLEISKAEKSGYTKDLFHLTETPEIEEDILQTDASALRSLPQSVIGSDIGIHVTGKKGINFYTDLLKKRYLERRGFTYEDDIGSKLVDQVEYETSTGLYEKINILPLKGKLDNTITIPDMGSFRTPSQWIKEMSTTLDPFGFPEKDKPEEMAGDLIDKGHFVQLERFGDARKVFPKKSVLEDLNNDIKLWKYIIKGADKHTDLRQDKKEKSWEKFLRNILDRKGADAFSYKNNKETGGELSYMFLHPEKLKSTFAKGFDPTKPELGKYKGGQVIPMYDGGMVQASAKPMYDGGLV